MSAAPENIFPEFDPRRIFLPPPEGPPIFVGWLPLGLPKIPRYQRPEPDHRVAKMTAAWDLLCVGALHISFRDGILWLVDGQTRRAAAQRRGLDRLPSIVVTGLTEREEAEKFLYLNRDRLAVTALSRHRAEVIAEEPRAVAIDDVLADHGLHPWRTAPEGFVPFTPIAKAEECFGWGGPDLLHRTLTLLTLAFADDSGRYQGKYVAGLGFFLSHDPWGADDERVLRILSKVGTSKLEEAAHHAHQLFSGGGKGHNSPMHMARAIATKVYPKRTDWKPDK